MFGRPVRVVVHALNVPLGSEVKEGSLVHSPCYRYGRGHLDFMYNREERRQLTTQPQVGSTSTPVQLRSQLVYNSTAWQQYFYTSKTWQYVHTSTTWQHIYTNTIWQSVLLQQYSLAVSSSTSVQLGSTSTSVQFGSGFVYISST